jgi:hypothetical protein
MNAEPAANHSGALQCELHSRLQALSDDLEDLEGVIVSDEQVV